MKFKIFIKSLLECLKILLWCTCIGILMALIKKYIPVVLFIALPISIIMLFITIYDSNRE